MHFSSLGLEKRRRRRSGPFPQALSILSSVLSRPDTEWTSLHFTREDVSSGTGQRKKKRNKSHFLPMVRREEAERERETHDHDDPRQPSVRGRRFLFSLKVSSSLQKEDAVMVQHAMYHCSCDDVIRISTLPIASPQPSERFPDGEVAAVCR